MNFDLVALPELKRLDDGGRKTNGQAVSPSGDQHAILKILPKSLI
jgi:hypothetical protein